MNENKFDMKVRRDSVNWVHNLRISGFTAEVEKCGGGVMVINVYGKGVKPGLVWKYLSDCASYEDYGYEEHDTLSVFSCSLRGYTGTMSRDDLVIYLNEFCPGWDVPLKELDPFKRGNTRMDRVSYFFYGE
jgi:hypothetical protein